MSQNKPRVLKDYEKLDKEVQEQIKLMYPNGFSGNLISYTDKEGKKISVLPFETEDKYYMIKMTVSEAKEIVEEDDDYNDEGTLKDSVKEEYQDKYLDIDDLSSGELDIDDSDTDSYDD